MYKPQGLLKDILLSVDSKGVRHTKEAKKPYFVVELKGLGVVPMYKSKAVHEAQPINDLSHFGNTNVAQVANDKTPENVFVMLVSPGPDMTKIDTATYFV